MPCCTPRNIVLVGATDKPGNYAERIWNNLIKYKFEGRPLSAQQQSAKTVWGVPCYKDFARPCRINPITCSCLVPGAFRGSGDPGCRPRPAPASGDDRNLRLQRIAGRREPESLPPSCNRLSRKPASPVTGPELPWQFERRRKSCSPTSTTAWSTMEAGPGRHRRSIRRDRDGDPAGAGKIAVSASVTWSPPETRLDSKTPDLMTYFPAARPLDPRESWCISKACRNTKVFPRSLQGRRRARRAKPVIALKLRRIRG